MLITKEISLEDFEPWGQAKYMFNKLSDFNMLDNLEFTLEDIYPDGMDETDLNDLLAYEDIDILADMCGYRSQSEIQDDIDDLKDERIALDDQLEEEEIDEDEYNDEISRIEEQLEELEEELSFYE